MEIRQISEREVEGICVPWDEISYLTPNPNGEMFARGSLSKTVKEKGNRLLLFRQHDHSHAVGKALTFDPGHADGLFGRFYIGRTPHGESALQELAEGLLDAFSVGFRPVRTQKRKTDGAEIILEAALHEISICPLGAYEGARVLATRQPSLVEFPPAPYIDLSPIPPLGFTYR